MRTFMAVLHFLHFLSALIGFILGIAIFFTADHAVSVQGGVGYGLVLIASIYLNEKEDS